MTVIAANKDWFTSVFTIRHVCSQIWFIFKNSAASFAQVHVHSLSIVVKIVAIDLLVAVDISSAIARSGLLHFGLATMTAKKKVSYHKDFF